MGYMKQLDNIFVILVLALVCAILPVSVMMFIGFAMMIGHCYAVGPEVAGFMLVLILFMMILFLRFSGSQNLTLILTPLSFGFSVPTLLPLGAGLLGSAVSALPAGCGVVIYYFIRFVHAQSAALSDQGTEIAEKLKLLSDGLVQNWAMWITVIAFVVVVLLVNLLRTRSFDYAWRIAIIAGGVAYILVILAGDFCLDVTVSMVPMIISTVVSVLIGFVLEFFVYGGDYSRTERLEYEDDEYYYYVKAVPKASVATSERSIKKINAEPVREEKKKEDKVVFREENFPERKETPVTQKPDFGSPVNETPQKIDEIDFEKQLEESLKDLLFNQTAEQLFGVELRSEADREYPLDIFLLMVFYSG